MFLKSSTIFDYIYEPVRLNCWNHPQRLSLIVLTDATTSNLIVLTDPTTSTCPGSRADGGRL